MDSSDVAEIKRPISPCRIGSSVVARRARSAAGLLLLLLSAAAPASDSDNPGSEFSAIFKFSGKQGNRQMGGTIVVNRYTPVEEARQAAEILRSQGQAGLANALRGRANGVLRLGALEYSLDLVTAKPTSKGFKLLVVTNRPIRYQETDQGSASLDYPFGIVVIEIDSLGRGEGRFFPSAALRIQEDGAIDVYQYAEGEGRVTDVKKVR
jgi:hypothetical protein